MAWSDRLLVLAGIFVAVCFFRGLYDVIAWAL